MKLLTFHHALLSDEKRLRAYQRAVREVVRFGDVVVDLGAGTGILGFFALQAGAARVYAIDNKPILRVARLLARENGFEDRIHFIKDDIRRVRLPERADVVVCDLVGRLGINEKTIQLVLPSRKFLKPGGRFIPQHADIWVAPVCAPRAHRRYVHVASGLGLRLETFHRLTAHSICRPTRRPGRLLSPMKRAFTFNFLRGNRPSSRTHLHYNLSGGPAHGLAVEVRLRLSPHEEIHPSPETLETYHQPLFLPVYAPVRARTVEVELIMDVPWNMEWSMAGQRQSIQFTSDDFLRHLPIPRRP